MMIVGSVVGIIVLILSIKQQKNTAKRPPPQPVTMDQAKRFDADPPTTTAPDTVPESLPPRITKPADVPPRNDLPSNLDAFCELLESKGVQFRRKARIAATTPGTWLTVTIDKKETLLLVCHFAKPDDAKEYIQRDPPGAGQVFRIWEQFVIIGPRGEAFDAIIRALPY